MGVDCIAKLGASDAEERQDMFGKDSGSMGGYLNKEALAKKFARSDVYDNTKINFPNPEKGFPGSISKDNARIASVQNWGRFAHQERDKGRQEMSCSVLSIRDSHTR